MIRAYSWPTPNGHKVHIMLYECELEHEIIPIDIAKGDQFDPYFLSISPNNRIPAIVDTDGPGGEEISVFETAAILYYLAHKTGKFLPSLTDDPRGHYRVMEWLEWQMGGIGPMMGQANVFNRYAPERIPYAIDRYQGESRRLFEVLESQLSTHDYLAKDYSIADIATWPWVRIHEWSGVDIDGLPALSDWLLRVGERPAVQRGMEVLKPVAEAKNDDDKVNVGRTMLL